MEQKEGKPSEDGTMVAPTTKDCGTPGAEAPAEETIKGTAETTITEGPPGGAREQGTAALEDGISAESHGVLNGSEEAKVELKKEAGEKEEAEGDFVEEADGQEEATVTSQEETDRKEETKHEPGEVKEKEEATLAPEKQQADEKEVHLDSKKKADVNDKATPEPEEAVGEETTDRDSKTDSEKKVDVRDEVKAQPQEGDENEAKSGAKALLEPGSPVEEKAQDVEKELEEGAAVSPSSPEEGPKSPTDENHSFSPDELDPDSVASGETSPSASESSPSDAPQSPEEAPPSEKKGRAPERRVPAPARPRGPRAQNRKAIVDKFGGAASGPTALFRNKTAAGAAIGGVKSMLLEWCRAMTRNYEHVDIQNFSSSWSSGMAFCALIHRFFPEAFDYATLDPAERRHNFTLAFSTAEKLADCAQLLEVDDMVRLAVPDSKCVYTYIQELYRSLVQKGLVKTKKK